MVKEEWLTFLLLFTGNYLTHKLFFIVAGQTKDFEHGTLVVVAACEPRNITGRPSVSIMYVAGWAIMWAYDMLFQ